MAQPNEFYVIQPAFTGGELSDDVASRVDLEKYQLSLLQAENAIIRPYGAVKKRTGFIYQGAAKYPDKKARLVCFNFSTSIAYIIEFGDRYARIWRDGVYLGVEVETPFESSELNKLRCVQSVDVMYITSGTHPVKKLIRYAEDNWVMEDVGWTLPAFDELNDDKTNLITPSGVSGSITLTATNDTFTSANVGDWIKFEQIGGGESVNLTSGTSDALVVGDTWKIITHGTWKGNVVVQRSPDWGVTWVQERKYTSNDDYNPTESGVVSKYCLMRVIVTTTSGTCTCDFSSYTYTHIGHAQITAVTDAKHATATVVNRLANTTATADWYWGAWSESFGYPVCAAFFQDRLCFAGCAKRPQRVWMSRTGDYENFGVDNTDGSVTDDSAITADLLSLRAYTIGHMITTNDLILLSDGNEWTISGAQVVTPSNISPLNQLSYGASDTTPVRVGNRIVYCQKRGSIVRDMGYIYESDSYGGSDLTLLAKHLITGYDIGDSAYAQEPDSMLFFTRSDGTLLALTYIVEQKVYGWAHMVTDGYIESVETAPTGNNDIVYAVVRREINGQTVRYIESLSITRSDSDQQMHTMMDCAKLIESDTPITTVTGLDYLEGKEVQVMGDGYLFNPMTVENGQVILPQAAKSITVGLPYTMIVEQPNIEVQMRDGTAQGRKKTVAYAILRLTQSFGGEIGPDANHLSAIRYDSQRMELGENVLYTGDVKATLKNGGFNTRGRVYIRHAVPYPFTLSAIIRVCTFGG